MLIAMENVLFMGDNILLVVLKLKEKGDYKTTCSPLLDAFGRRNYKNSKTHIFLHIRNRKYEYMANKKEGRSGCKYRWFTQNVHRSLVTASFYIILNFIIYNPTIRRLQLKSFIKHPRKLPTVFCCWYIFTTPINTRSQEKTWTWEKCRSGGECEKRCNLL